MLIGLHDAEKEHLKRSKIKFPNFALMKIAAWHKNKGDSVEWWNKDKIYDKVYSSKTFDFTPENPDLPPDTVKGGTGYRLFGNLPHKMDVCFPDYSIYPDCDYAIGFLTRGCPNNCSWCVVPKKEGGIRPCANWEMLIRPDSDKLILLDNNILACEYGINQLAELTEIRYKIDLNQGMDITLLTEENVAILAKIKWLKYVRFSCDDGYKLPYFERMTELFRKHGIALSRVFIYVLVRKDLEAADCRVQGLHKICKNFNLYAQAERNSGIVPTKMQLEFAQKYVYKGLYKKETWGQYCRRLGLDSD